MSKVYGEGRTAAHALRGVDLEIPSRELVVLLGPSGSGKSTLLNILGGIDRASSGKAFFRGEELTAMSDRQLTAYRRERVGFVFQFYNLMPSLTALENVELVAEIASDPLPSMEALELVGLKNRAKHFPSELSGGEQQRVAIARAIAKNPTVLFCDEPTGALDSATGVGVLKALQDLNARLTPSSPSVLDVRSEEQARAAVAMREADLENARAALISPEEAERKTAGTNPHPQTSIPLRAPISGRSGFRRLARQAARCGVGFCEVQFDRCLRSCQTT